MSDMVSVPAEKIDALREAARTKIFSDGPNANALYKAARAVVDAVETEAETAPPAYPDILSEIEERRTDEAFMERIRNRVAEDADLLQRIGDDELYIADLRAQLSQAEAERDALRDERDRLAEQIATSTDRTELTALRQRVAELERELKHAKHCWHGNQEDARIYGTALDKTGKELDALRERIRALADEWEDLDHKDHCWECDRGSDLRKLLGDAR